MINPKLLAPKSIVVCGASSDIHKPGGKVLKNLKESGFKGQIYAVNPKETEAPVWPSLQNTVPQLSMFWLTRKAPAAS